MDLHRFEGNDQVFFDPQPHITDFFEIMVFQKAQGQIELNGYHTTIGENSFFFICPYQRKSCQISLEGIQGFHLVFQNEFLADFFDDKLFAYRLQYFFNPTHPQFLQLHAEDYAIIQVAFNEIIAEIENYQSNSPHIIRSLLYFALSKLNRLYSKHYQISSDTVSNSTMYRFKELLEQHIRSRHAVQDYCELLQLNRHKMNAMTKAHFGRTAKEVINNRLLSEIKSEIRYSDKTIAEIAYELHFSEANNLTRFFHKMEGISPTAYRAQHQNDRDL